MEPKATPPSEKSQRRARLSKPQMDVVAVPSNWIGSPSSPL